MWSQSAGLTVRAFWSSLWRSFCLPHRSLYILRSSLNLPVHGVGRGTLEGYHCLAPAYSREGWADRRSIVDELYLVVQSRSGIFFPHRCRILRGRGCRWQHCGSRHAPSRPHTQRGQLSSKLIFRLCYCLVRTYWLVVGGHIYLESEYWPPSTPVPLRKSIFDCFRASASCFTPIPRFIDLYLRSVSDLPCWMNAIHIYLSVVYSRFLRPLFAPTTPFFGQGNTFSVWS